MIEIPILDANGKKVGSETLDPALLGGKVRQKLLKQAVVAYRANARQGSVSTRSRGMVQGSSRKLYRQKGTGRARMGNIRTPVRRGGGMAFAKINRDFSQKLNRKMRSLARNNAILAKALSGAASIVRGLKFESPKTAAMAAFLKAANLPRGALIAMRVRDENLIKSGRNIPGLDTRLIQDVNAYDVLKSRHLLFTSDAFAALKDQTAKSSEA